MPRFVCAGRGVLSVWDADAGGPIPWMQRQNLSGARDLRKFPGFFDFRSIWFGRVPITQNRQVVPSSAADPFGVSGIPSTGRSCLCAIRLFAASDAVAFRDASHGTGRPAFLPPSQDLHSCPVRSLCAL